MGFDASLCDKGGIYYLKFALCVKKYYISPGVFK